MARRLANWVYGSRRAALRSEAEYRHERAIGSHEALGRIGRTDLRYPLELFRSAGRWVIVDGYHRLVRHRLEDKTVVPVRLHEDELWKHVVVP